MTTEGEQALRTELDHLRTEVRPSVTQAIAEARKHGDLKENAEYHAAKEKQSLVERRIVDIERQLATSQVIDIHQIKPNGKVMFGATVELIAEDDSIRVYRIVGENEADPLKGLISMEAPLAKALIGQTANSIIELDTAEGITSYKIKSIQYL